jgi:type VI secretion system protein ImpE
MWLPFEHIDTVRVEAPKKLRDLLWAPAIVRPAETFTGLELGEALLPVIAPLTWKHSDAAVRLGRVTEWQELDNGEQAPVGQKMLLVDDEEFPILELRELVIEHAPAASS